MTESAVQLFPRGIGKNWIECGWCDDTDLDLKHDMACFVKSELMGDLALRILKEVHITASLDLRRASENRFQIKVGACSHHLPNLDLLGMILSTHPLTATLALRTCPWRAND